MAGVAETLERLIRLVPDFPKPGVVFRDITPLLADPVGFRTAVDALGEGFGAVDVVAGVESRGFLLAAPLAYALGAGVVPMRKAGRLPGPVHEAAYALEYGEAVLQVHRDAFAPGARVLVLDDVLATGGTAGAAVGLVEACGAVPVGLSFLLEIDELGGRPALARTWPDLPVRSLVRTSG